MMWMVNGHNVLFMECTAICGDFQEEGRRKAIFVHDEADLFGDGDGVLFGYDYLPDGNEEAEAFLEDFLDTDYSTLDTVEF